MEEENKDVEVRPQINPKDVNVFVWFINPYQIKDVVDQTQELVDQFPKLREFIDKDFTLNNHPLNLLGNYSNVFTNGRVLNLCWVSCKEDKELCLIKIDKFFRKEYRFADIETGYEIHRVLNKD